ncbi:MAG TPA: hypothetical protein PLC15_03250 [Candidatus Obscuribacter sp.]|nr:hypothetical protein [Candidatus Obscuribacter sp.]HNA73660.1 hypothetical protein [Candidatus Obscuribacter sp.]HNB14366.1 hypothetical protein [Candidatus Obscuribacter sp.]HND08151.1 hypothetical protein [Candidatus Obscuribacter sp.]HNG20688.1 hypothetical protein [Candidatus Obscuribacter sp.]
MQSPSPGKKPFVILVTSTQGGSGRSLIASALATHLTRFGEVALMGDDVAGRGYFGSAVLHPGSRNILSAAPEIIAQATNFGYHLNRLRLIEQIGETQPLPERVAAVKPFHQFVILCAESRLESTTDFTKARSRSEMVDLTIPVYRQTERSHYLTSMLQEIAKMCELYLPVANFLSNAKEVDLGSHWTLEALKTFGECFNQLLKVCPNLHMRDPESIFHGTAFSYTPVLSYGSVNPMFKFSATAPGTPANAISNIANIVLAAAG